MSGREPAGAYSGHDDLDEDIERLNIVLLGEQGEEDVESDSELQVLVRIDDEPYSHASTSRLSTSRSRPSTSSDVTASSFPTTSMGTEADDLVLRFDPLSINAESSLAMNRAYQEVLLDSLRQIEMSLNENRARQKQLSENLEEMSTKGGKQSAPKLKPLTEYTAPYFRDPDGHSAPCNEDVKVKATLHEEKQHVRQKPGWSKAQRKILLNAVRMDALEQQIRPLMNKLEVATSKVAMCKTMEEIEQSKERIAAIKEQIQGKQRMETDELLASVDNKKIDFMKISAVEFNGKYSPAECESMWMNVLQPDINRDKWAPEEEKQLVELAQKHSMRNWKTIAQELGTHRTPFQCLQHLQQKHYVFDTSEWTQEEDELLREVVETCQIGSGKTMWQQVAYYMERRSAAQCKLRWIKVSPYVKRGRWSDQEDVLLTTAVQMLGDNDWVRVQEFVPFRNATQCRERWQNCLNPQLKMGQWSYEEDKKLIHLYEEYGRNWASLANQMPGRTDNMCLCRYKILLKWRKNCDAFNSEPLEVRKSMISSYFEINDKNQIVPKRRFLVKSEKKIKVAEQKKKKELEEKPPKKRKWGADKDEDYVVEEEDDVEHNQWDKFCTDRDIQIVDYLKQIEDAEKGDLVVPRPPPLKKYTARSYTTTWSRRKALQGLVQSCVNTVTNREGVADPEETVDNITASLGPIMNIDKSDKEKWDLISHALKGRMPHELTVRQLLDISRAIKETGTIPQYLIEEVEAEEYDEESDSDDSDAKVESSGEEEDRDEEAEYEEDDQFEEEEEVPKVKKPRRELTEDEKIRERIRGKKMAAHREVQERIRYIIRQKWSGTYLGKPKRQRTYQLFPESSSSSGPRDMTKMVNKSLAILLKSFDVDAKEVYNNANRTKRKHSALAFLKSTTCRRSQRQLTARHQNYLQTKSEETETAEMVLELKNELGIGDSDEEMEVVEDEPVQVDSETSSLGHGSVELSNKKKKKKKGRPRKDQRNFYFMGTPGESGPDTSVQSGEVEKHRSVGVGVGSDSVDTASAASCRSSDVNVSTASSTVACTVKYDKMLPYIPPNRSNLAGMKALLLDHRGLIDTAGTFFDKEEFKDHLYSIKSVGPNPLLPVFMSVSRMRGRAPKKVNVINTEEGGEIQRKHPKHVLVQKIRKTREYQLLKARFQSLFVWPALMATIPRPKLKTPANEILEVDDTDENTIRQRGRKFKKVEVVDDDTNVDEGQELEGAEEMEDESGAGFGEASAEGAEGTEEMSEADVEQNVARAVEEVMEEEGKDLTHEEAIEKLVDKILEEYRATRESKKRNHIKKSRKKLSENAIQGSRQRERTKILKRLGLLDVMEEYRRQREAQEAEANTAEAAQVSAEDELSVVVKEEPDAVVVVVAEDQDSAKKRSISLGTNTEEGDEEEGPVRKRGRPKGAKNWGKMTNENVRKSSRQVEKPTSLEDSVVIPQRKSQRGKAVKLSRLKELIPEKMSNLMTQIPDLPLMKDAENDTHDGIADKNCRKEKRQKMKKGDKVKGKGKGMRVRASRKKIEDSDIIAVKIEQDDTLDTEESAERVTIIKGMNNNLNFCVTQALTSAQSADLEAQDSEYAAMDTFVQEEESEEAKYTAERIDMSGSTEDTAEDWNTGVVGGEDDADSDDMESGAVDQPLDFSAKQAPEQAFAYTSDTGAEKVEMTASGTAQAGLAPASGGTILMAMPVSVGGQQQVVYVPVQVGADGKVSLALQPPTSVPSSTSSLQTTQNSQT